MQKPVPTDGIRLRQRKSMADNLAEAEESSVSLSEKLDELFAAGYLKEDIYGLVIPLLMQGKVRVDMGSRSERLEMEDQNQRLHRSGAMLVYERYLLVRQPSVPLPPSPRPAVPA